MTEALLEAVIDSLKLIPFLFVTYLLMGMLERAASDSSRELIAKAGKAGPLWGSLIGVIPQCGLSAAASYFYVGKAITLGTLIAIYMSTSDEMLPIFLAEHIPVIRIVKIMAAKVLIGTISGFLIEWMFGRLTKRRRIPDHYTDDIAAGCHCTADLLIDAIVKTLKVFVLVLLISAAIELSIYVIGIGKISELFLEAPILGELIAGFIGLIPNCAASVVISQLYLEGVIGAGPMMTGLLVSAGVGILVLCKENRHWKQNVMVIALLYGVSVIWGILIETAGIQM